MTTRSHHDATSLPLLGLCLTFMPATHALDTFMNLGAPAALAGASTYGVRPADVSNDGGVMVGTAFGTLGEDFKQVGFSWTEAGGYADIATLLPENDGASAYGISDDGLIIAGDYILPGTYESRGFHLASGTLTEIAPLEGDSYVRVSGVSANGLIVVGYTGSFTENEVAASAAPPTLAFRWDSGSGTVEKLGSLGGISQAFGTNADGSVVVGSSFLSNLQDGSRAFLWTSAGGMQDLGRIGENGSSSAYAVSNDGTVVVGSSTSGAEAPFDHAFRWTTGNGMVDIHGFAGDFSTAYGVSGDGLVVVGEGLAAAEDASTTAFRWTAEAGMQTVEAWLSGNGVSVSEEPETKTATATNGNGSVVVGTLRSGDAFMARVGDPGTGAGGGLIGLRGFAQTLVQTQAAAGQSARSALLAMQGAYSRPLSRRVGQGENFLRVAGDWGEDDHDARDGTLGLAGLSLGRNLGPGQFNLSAGYSTAHDARDGGGKATTQGAYLHGEWLMPLLAREEKNIWAVVSAYYQWGETDIRRSYRNAGRQDSSFGSPDSDAWGTGLHLEWDSVLQVQGFSMSPYVGYMHMETTLDAYSETGGAFSAVFNSLDEDLDELRYGINVERALSPIARLIASVEGVHRVDDEGSSAQATLLGPGGFSISAPGREVEQDWVRGGAGVEVDVLGGTAGMMANGTSEGEAPSWWIAASWRTRF